MIEEQRPASSVGCNGTNTNGHVAEMLSSERLADAAIALGQMYTRLLSIIANLSVCLHTADYVLHVLRMAAVCGQGEIVVIGKAICSPPTLPVSWAIDYLKNNESICLCDVVSGRVMKPDDVNELFDGIMSSRKDIIELLGCEQGKENRLDVVAKSDWLRQLGLDSALFPGSVPRWVSEGVLWYSLRYVIAHCQDLALKTWTFIKTHRGKLASLTVSGVTATL